MIALQLALAPDLVWRKVAHDDPRGRELADRHYSRQTVGARDYTAPGRKLVLLHEVASGRAVWAVVENMDPVGTMRWRVTLFRNEAGTLSSDLVRAATMITIERWRRRYGCTPWPLETEVDPAKTRRKRDPGRCFVKAGWTPHRCILKTRLLVLQAPEAA